MTTRSVTGAKRHWQRWARWGGHYRNRGVVAPPGMERSAERWRDAVDRLGCGCGCTGTRRRPGQREINQEQLAYIRRLGAQLSEELKPYVF